MFLSPTETINKLGTKKEFLKSILKDKSTVDQHKILQEQDLTFRDAREQGLIN